ncbi:MAG: NB-ARC domain-containing protein [Cyanobacteria bacterium J06634_6]
MSPDFDEPSESQSMKSFSKSDENKLADKDTTSRHCIDGSGNIIIYGNHNQVAITSNSKISTSIPFQAKSLREYKYFVARPKHLKELTKLLLLDAKETLGIVAIHGLGGIGKTVLASALAEELQSHFCDGILWASLGKQPDLTSLLMGWIQGLNDYNFKLIGSDAVQMATLHLRSLLRNRKVLLVVDDVWEVEHLKPFLVGGPDCRLLFTTRRANVADDIDVVPYQLGVMSEAESLQLLKKALNCPLEKSDVATAKAVVKLVGYLPLALNIIAARLRKGFSLARIQQDFSNNLISLEKSSRPRSSEKSLEAVFNLSLNPLKEDFPKIWESFVWLGLLQEDALITVPTAAHLWQIDLDEAADRLDLLWNDSLLVQDASVGINKPQGLTYRIHDLLRDKAHRLISDAQVPKIGSTLLEAQAHFLQRYRSYTTQQLWHTLPDDGYIHQVLSWHMAEAGQPELIHELLKEEDQANQNGWYRACERLGLAHVFIQDVSRAWDLANISYIENPAQSLGLSFRYALIQSSLNILTTNLPPTLMAALVKHGYWSSRQAFIYVRQLQNEEAQTRAIEALAPYVSIDLLPEALTITQNIQNDEYRATVLTTLIPHLPTDLLVEILAITQNIQNDEYRVIALTALVPHIPIDLLAEILTAAQNIQHEKYYVEVLALLIPYLPTDLFPQVLDYVRDIQNEHYRTDALIALVPYIPVLVSEALMAEQLIQEAASRAKVFIALIPYVPESITKALAATQQIQEAASRAKVLMTLIPYVPESASEALAATQQITDQWGDRSKMLTLLIPHFPINLLPEALAMAKQMRSKFHRAEVLIALAPYLPTVAPEAWSAVQAVAQNSDYYTSSIKLFTDLIPHLQTDLFPEVLAFVQQIRHANYRAKLLIVLIPKIPAATSEAFSVVQDIMTAQNSRSSSDHMTLLHALLPHLPKELIPQLLSIAQDIQRVSERAHALATLVPYLPSVASEALTTVGKIRNSAARKYLLPALIPHLSTAFLPEALAVANKIHDERYQAEALITFIPYVPAAASDALAIVKDINQEFQYGRHRVESLVTLIPHLPTKLIPDVLTIARDMKFGSERTKALTALIPYLPEIVAEAFAAAQGIESESQYGYITRAQAFTALIPYVPEAAAAAFTAAQNIPFVLARVAAFTALIPNMTTAAPKALEAAQDVEYVHDRAKSICNLIPHLPPELIPEVLLIIQDSQNEDARDSLLAALSPNLPIDLIPEAWATVPGIRNERQRTKALSAISPYLPPHLMQEALATAEKIQDMRERVRTLASLIPYLSIDSRLKVLADAQTVQFEMYRAGLLAALVPYLPTERLLEVFTTALSLQDARDRSYVLIALSPYFPEAIPEALAVIHQISDEWGDRAKALTALIPNLPTTLLPEALILIQSIQSAISRAHLLATLLPNFPEVTSESLVAAQEILEEKQRVRALAALIPHLPTELFPSALTATLEIQNEERRSELLTVFIRQLLHWTGSDNPYPLFQTILQDGFGRGSRQRLLSAVPEMVPLLSRLGGPDIWPVLHQSIQDICRQWP